MLPAVIPACEILGITFGFIFAKKIKKALD